MQTSSKTALVITIWLIAAHAIPAPAELSPALRDWPQGPVQFLLLDSERAEYAALQSDAEAQEFIDLFWARRDPDLATPVNEFKFAFEARVLAADNEFGNGERPGALSARGRALILLGPPDQHAKMPIADYLSQLYKTPAPHLDASDPEAHVTMQGITFNHARGEADLWAFTPESLPEGAYEGDDPVVLAFFDVAGNGEFALQGGIRKAQVADGVLLAASAVFLLHPEMTEAPCTAVLAGVQAADEGQLAILDRDDLAWPDEAVAFAGQGIAGRRTFPNWFFVLVPANLATADVVVGRVTGDGKDLGSFQIPVAGTATPVGTAYDFALPEVGGHAKVDFVLLAAGTPLAGHHVALEQMTADAGTMYFSPAYAGVEIGVEDDAAAGDAFVFGGYHLTLRPEGRYRNTDALSIFCLATGPPDLENGGMKARVRLRWYLDGKAAPSAAPQEVQLMPVGPDVWVWGTQLPLDSLNPGLDYMLKVKISNPDGSVKRTTEIPVVVRAVDEAGQ